MTKSTIEYYTLQPSQLDFCTSHKNWFRGGLLFLLEDGTKSLCSKCFETIHPDLFQSLLNE